VFFEFKSDAGSHYYVGFAERLDHLEKCLGKYLLMLMIHRMTHENEPLKIMSTVVATIKEFIATPQYHKGNLKFVFEGIPKSGSIDSTWVPT
jgi:GTP:adenosylcobinamide-phosphate guanylyltransferase